MSRDLTYFSTSTIQVGQICYRNTKICKGSLYSEALVSQIELNASKPKKLIT